MRKNGTGDYMSFTKIETQEQFDEAIKERLSRERESITKKYEGYTSKEDVDKLKADYDKQINDLRESEKKNAEKYKDYDSQIAQKDAQIKKYETDSVKTRIANEFGLPYEIASRLKGDDEKSIREDAENLAKFVSKKKVAPRKESENSGNEEGDKASYLSLVRSLRKE